MLFPTDAIIRNDIKNLFARIPFKNNKTLLLKHLIHGNNRQLKIILTIMIIYCFNKKEKK